MIPIGCDMQLFEEIRKIFAMRANPLTKRDSEYADVCISWMQTLHLEAAAGALFLTPAGEEEYLTSIGVVIALGLEFEKNRKTIRRICDSIAAIPLTPTPENHNMYHIINGMNGLHISTHVSHSMLIHRTMYDTIERILAIHDQACRKTMIDLFDKYIMSLAIVGKQSALACHQPLTDLGRRMPQVDKYIIQSIGDPDFSMRDFLFHGPITMFYGYVEPAINEVAYIHMGFDELIPHPGRLYHFDRPGCGKVIRAIHGIPRGTLGMKQVEKMYPDATCRSIVHMFVRPA